VTLKKRNSELDRITKEPEDSAKFVKAAQDVRLVLYQTVTPLGAPDQDKRRGWLDGSRSVIAAGARVDGKDG
jgi:hypothetical protein